MPLMRRRPGRADLAIALIDEGLRGCFAPGPAARPSPAAVGAPDESALADEERAESLRLMRVNRAGEIAAQALYLGQALTASTSATRTALLEAADEERDHLAWCTDRIRELGGRPSLLDPVWFGGSACLGAAVGLGGDAVSLGFVAETERQVESHLADHISRLPAADRRSNAVLQQMAADEARHGSAATAAGGTPLPRLATKLMALGGEILRRCAYRI